MAVPTTDLQMAISASVSLTLHHFVIIYFLKHLEQTVHTENVNLIVVYHFQIFKNYFETVRGLILATIKESLSFV